MHTWVPLTNRFQVPPELAESQLLQWGLCTCLGTNSPRWILQWSAWGQNNWAAYLLPQTQKEVRAEVQGCFQSSDYSRELLEDSSIEELGPSDPVCLLSSVQQRHKSLGTHACGTWLSTSRKVRALILNSVWFEWKLNSLLFAHRRDQSSPSCHFLKNKSYC